MSSFSPASYRWSAEAHFRRVGPRERRARARERRERRERSARQFQAAAAAAVAACAARARIATVRVLRRAEEEIYSAQIAVITTAWRAEASGCWELRHSLACVSSADKSKQTTRPSETCTTLHSRAHFTFKATTSVAPSYSTAKVLLSRLQEQQPWSCYLRASAAEQE